MKTRIFCSVICLYVPSASIAAAVPVDLMFHQKPIDALCFNDPKGKEMNLEQCGLQKAGYVLKGQNASLIAKGYTGYNWQDPAYPDSPEGYSYYKFYTAGKNEYWVYSINSGGGSGEFTAIHRIKRKNTNTMTIESVVGGDRCNGGLLDTSMVNNHLRFTQNLTAWDLVALPGKFASTVKAYDELAACAVCCVATAQYELSPDSGLQLMYVDLGDFKNKTELPDQGVLQSCFNRLFTTYVDTGKTRLNTIMLDAFAEKFHQTCKSNENI